MNSRVLEIIGGLALVIILLQPMMRSSPTTAEQLFQDAETLYMQTDYEGAIHKYSKALEEAIKHRIWSNAISRDFRARVHYKIASSYSHLAEKSGNLNHYYTAITYIKKAVPAILYPDEDEGLTYLWGYILYKTEQFALAEAKFLQLIQNFPDSLLVENAWYAIGQMNYKLQNYEDSRRAFKCLLSDFPNSEYKDDAQLLIAQSLFNEAHYRRPYQEFDKIAKVEDRNYPSRQAEAMYKAAYSLHQLGRDDEAIGRYTNFITQFPESQYVTAAYFDQGAIYARQKDYDKALVNYELALQNSADRGLQSEIQAAIGRTYYEQGDYENAIVSYTTLLEEYPESEFIAESKLGIADSHFRLEAWREAGAAYERVINEHEDKTDFTPYCSYQLGESYYQLGTQQKKAGESEQGVTTLELALFWYQKTIDIFPDDVVTPNARYHAIWILKALGRKEEFVVMAREFIRRYKPANEFSTRVAEVEQHLIEIRLQELTVARSIEVGQLFQDAEALYHQEDYERAIAKYVEALKKATKYGAKMEEIARDFPTLVNYRIAVCYNFLAAESGNATHYNTALQYINKIAPTATLPKEQGGLTYFWGHILYKTEQFELAQEKFEQLIQNYPDSPYIELALYTVGILNYELQNYENSRRAFKSLLSDVPNSEYKNDARYFIAQSLFNEAHYRRAYQEFDKIAKVEDRNYPSRQAEVMYKAAYSLHQLGRDDEAIRRYTNFTKQFPESHYVTTAYFYQGTLYARQKNYDKALVSYKLALQNSADRTFQSEMQAVIGRTYEEQGDYKNTIASYTTLLEAYPESDFVVEAKRGIADSHFRRQEWREAAAAYERVINEHRDKTDFIPYCSYRLGQLCSRLAIQLTEAGESEESIATLELALSWYQKTIDIFPDDAVTPNAHYGAIWILNALERKEEFKLMAREFIRKYKHDDEFSTLVAEVEQHLIEIRPQELTVARSKEAEQLFQDAEALYYQGDYQDAIALHTKLLNKIENTSNNPDSDELLALKIKAYYRLGMIYQDKLNQPRKAYEVFQLLIDEDKGSLSDNIGVIRMMMEAKIRVSTDFQSFQSTMPDEANQILRRGESQNPRLNSSQTGYLKPEQIAQKGRRSTVIILQEHPNREAPAFGSGFFISRNHIVSNWHVIEGASDVLIMQIDEGTIYEIEEVTAKNVRQNLVILKVSGKGTPLTLGDSNTVQIGEPIYATSHHGLEANFSTGIVSRLRMLQSGERIQISAPVSFGSSGGPLLNNKGKVIGIVYEAEDTNNGEIVTLAIPVNYLKALLTW